ncbi:MAG: hypothetical protein RIQ46_512 [Pseudomonadota bacterium]
MAGVRILKARDGHDACLAGADDPIHIAIHRLNAGEILSPGPQPREGALYVWQGRLAAGASELPAGSSVILESGASIDAVAGPQGAVLVHYTSNAASARPSTGCAHLLPADAVPRYDPPPGESGAAGGLHADGQCPGCAVWLHENSLPAVSDADAPAMAERGIHAHSEDEIIFVTHGAMRLGRRLFGPGTALAIPAGTFYSFTPGPEGLHFINYRNGPPAAFTMKGGGTFDEAGYWQDRVPSPRGAWL